MRGIGRTKVRVRDRVATQVDDDLLGEAQLSNPMDSSSGPGSASEGTYDVSIELFFLVEPIAVAEVGSPTAPSVILDV